MGIYVASRAKTRYAHLWRTLREAYPISSTWIDEVEFGQTVNKSEFWERVQREISECDALVLHFEKYDEPLKGAFVEVGMALAYGKRVFVSMHGVDLDPQSLAPLGSWILHPAVTLDEEPGALIRCIQNACPEYVYGPTSAASLK